jgi:hypothetical protein
VAGSCEYGDEPSGSGVAELVSYIKNVMVCKSLESASVFK